MKGLGDAAHAWRPSAKRLGRARGNANGAGERHSKGRHGAGTPMRVVDLKDHCGTLPATKGRVLATVAQSQCSAAEKAKLLRQLKCRIGVCPRVGRVAKRIVYRGVADVITGRATAQRLVCRSPTYCDRRRCRRFRGWRTSAMARSAPEGTTPIPVSLNAR